MAQAREDAWTGEPELHAARWRPGAPRYAAVPSRLPVPARGLLVEPHAEPPGSESPSFHAARERNARQYGAVLQQSQLSRTFPELFPIARNRKLVPWYPGYVYARRAL